MSHVLICHSSEDIISAIALKQWLLANVPGVGDVFLDVNSIGAGERWEAAFPSCEQVILLSSADAALSPEWKAELRNADGSGRDMIVVLLHDLQWDDPRLDCYKDREILSLAAPPQSHVESVDYLGGHHEVRFSHEALLGLRESIERSQRVRDYKKPRPHTFVSYSHYDLPAAAEIVSRLEAANLKCWISDRDVPRGEDFQDAIAAALEKAGAMILVFSQHADNSKEIKKELALASDHGLLVLPVRIENVEPTRGFRYQLATRQYIDLFENREENMGLIITTLRNHLSVGSVG
ncbi:MAG: toll/interleukin-1 receptor domain-containing protein [Xanthobacteraceae bacterium]